MTRSRLLLGVAAVLAGAAVLFVVLGTVFNLLLVMAAVPFGIAAYFLWSHATGRLEPRIRREFADRTGRDGVASERWSARSDGAGANHTEQRSTVDEPVSMGRERALATLGLKRGASQRAIREAYRERAKAVHPDAVSGDEDEFRRLRAAYERLGSR